MSAMPNPTLVASADGRSMRVEHRGDDKFDINIRGHVVRVDQPVKDGGEDTGPTPTELFIASLASCVAFYARRYLARHDLPTDGLAVEATFEMGSRPARVAGIEVRLIVPEGVPGEVAAGVESHTRGQARDEQLGRGGPSVLATVLDRLVHADDMAADVDVELIVTPVLDPHRSPVGGGDQRGVGHRAHEVTLA